MNPIPAPVTGDVDLDALAAWLCGERRDWDPEELDRAIAGARANRRPGPWIARAMFTAAMDGDPVREFMLAATEAWRERESDLGDTARGAAEAFAVLGMEPPARPADGGEGR